jgi:hypothetical protein
MAEVWQQDEVINWCQVILNSYKKVVGEDLIIRKGDQLEESKFIFFAPFVVVSHGTEKTPIFNYANQMAQILWEMSWEEITSLPSRESAIPDARKVREKMLKEVLEKGYVQNFQGVRISQSGKLFRIEDVTVWNLLDENNNYCGQAATYPRWTFLDD